MKKYIPSALAMILALSLLCAGAIAAPAPSDLIGTWYLNSLEMGGMAFHPATLGMDMWLTLEESGAALIHGTGEVDQAGAWKLEGDQVILSSLNEEPPLAMVLADGVLTAEAEGTKMIFGKERVESQLYVAAPAREDALLKEYDGQWHATLADMFGMQFTMEMLNLDIALSIENGAGSAVKLENGVESTIALEGVFEGGALTLSGTAENGSTVVFPLRLHEDGAMSYTIEGQGVVYFEKVEQ